jgi:hypothetical protein
LWASSRKRPRLSDAEALLGGPNRTASSSGELSKTRSIAAWAKQLGISRQAMTYRVNECVRLGLDVELALTLPALRGRQTFLRRSAKHTPET